MPKPLVFSSMHNSFGLFPRFMTLDLQTKVQPCLAMQMLSKFLIMQNSVQAIWRGQKDDEQQVERKDGFVLVSYMADFN